MMLLSLLACTVAASRRNKGGSSRGTGETVLFPLEHSTDGGATFSPRGVVNVAFTRPSGVVRVENVALAPSFDEEFGALVRGGGFYHVRVRQEVGDERSASIVAVAKACALANSDFEDVFTLHLDEAKGRVLGLDYAAADEFNACGDASEAVVSSSAGFRSSGSVSFAERIAPLPLKNTNLMPPPGAKKAAAGKGGKGGAGGKEEAQPGFLRKYWYIILPVFVMMMLNPGEAPVEGGAGGGGGARAEAK